jgi:hypothetical protein
MEQAFPLSGVRRITEILLIGLVMEKWRRAKSGGWSLAHQPLKESIFYENHCESVFPAYAFHDIYCARGTDFRQHTSGTTGGRGSAIS